MNKLGFYKYTVVLFNWKHRISSHIFAILFLSFYGCGVENRKPQIYKEPNYSCDPIKGPRYALSKNKFGQKGVKKICDPETLKEENRKYYKNGKYIYCSAYSEVELSEDGNWFRCRGSNHKVDLSFDIYQDKKNISADSFFATSERTYFWDLRQYLCIGQKANSTQFNVGKASEDESFTCKAP